MSRGACGRVGGGRCGYLVKAFLHIGNFIAVLLVGLIVVLVGSHEGLQGLEVGGGDSNC